MQDIVGEMNTVMKSSLWDPPNGQKGGAHHWLQVAQKCQLKDHGQQNGPFQRITLNSYQNEHQFFDIQSDSFHSQYLLQLLLGNLTK